MKYFMDSGFNDKMDEIFDDNIPKIQTKFSPGSIWICDSIKSSHQVIYGNKCISFNYVIDGNTFDSKDNLYHKYINFINLIFYELHISNFNDFNKYNK